MSRYQIEVSVYVLDGTDSYRRLFRDQDYVETGTIQKAFDHGVQHAMEEFNKKHPEEVK